MAPLALLPTVVAAAVAGRHDASSALAPTADATQRPALSASAYHMPPGITMHPEACAALLRAHPANLVFPVHGSHALAIGMDDRLC